MDSFRVMIFTSTVVRAEILEDEGGVSDLDLNFVEGIPRDWGYFDVVKRAHRTEVFYTITKPFNGVDPVLGVFMTSFDNLKKSVFCETGVPIHLIGVNNDFLSGSPKRWGYVIMSPLDPTDNRRFVF
jgi:hypothetical protein